MQVHDKKYFRVYGSARTRIVVNSCHVAFINPATLPFPDSFCSSRSTYSERSALCLDSHSGRCLTSEIFQSTLSAHLCLGVRFHRWLSPR